MGHAPTAQGAGHLIGEMMLRMPKYKPEEWAAKAVLKMGWKEAFAVTLTTGRQLYGNQNDVPNPHFPWFREAKRWIKKNVPEGVELV